MGWLRAGGHMVTDMVNLSQKLYECEVDNVYTTDPLVLSRNLTRGIVEQFYNPSAEYVSCYYDNTKLIAYVWLIRGVRAPWSDDEVLEWKIAHVDLSLPVRTRIRLLNEMIDQSIMFAEVNNIPIILSSTVRSSQDTFLRLYESRGFMVRGSVAYLRLESRA